MPLDATSGVYWELHGPAHPPDRQQAPALLIGLPLMASFNAIFGPALQHVIDGYLQRLTDRYQVLLVDYPGIGRSRDIDPGKLTADRVCRDLLHVASAAGFERFAFWGYSWSGAVALQLAARTDRLSALVVGGWPPLGAPYAGILQATVARQADPEPSSLVILRSKAQYRQWETYYRSIIDWPEAESVARIQCPKLVMFGADGDLVEAGVPIHIASIIRKHRSQLQAQGWQVVEIPGEGHGVTMKPECVVPPVRTFLDAVLQTGSPAALL